MLLSISNWIVRSIRRVKHFFSDTRNKLVNVSEKKKYSLFSSGKEPPSLISVIRQIFKAMFVQWPQPLFNLAVVKSSEVETTYRWLEGKPLGLAA
ncbi:TPA: hypothetical protein VGT17_005534 [Vibrio harveyi]|nr:hypothetical protein [Vibrio harveyi]HEQ3599559.1 hypothetical protein [Vibrio harveyi]HEQ3611594.1 hypothetical protein [Vibrio harveyi]